MKEQQLKYTHYNQYTHIILLEKDLVSISILNTGFCKEVPGEI